MNNIIQWNCRGLRANFTDFRLFCDNYNQIVCCLQETILTKNYFLSRDGIPSSECTLNTSLQSKAVIISTSKTITICSLYLPHSENLNIVLLTRLIGQLPTPFVVCGDCNGHNSRGDGIDDCITDNNVCFLNNGYYTYLHPATGTFTTIDLSLCSPDILMEIDLWLNRICMVVIIFLLF